MREETKSLESLLRFRKALERMQWLRLQSVHAEAEKAERALELLERSRVNAKLELLEALRRGLDSAAMATYSTSGIEREIAGQQEAKFRLKHVFEEEHRVYLERRQQRETVEKALTRLRAEIEKELQRKEQMRIDDDTLKRMNRGSRKSLL